MRDEYKTPEDKLIIQLRELFKNYEAKRRENKLNILFSVTSFGFEAVDGATDDAFSRDGDSGYFLGGCDRQCFYTPYTF